MRNSIAAVALLVASAATAGTVAMPAPVLAQAAARAGTGDRDQLLMNAAESRSKGSETATVLVYEIADFQCPHCGRFARDVFPSIDSAYVRTGRVQWVFVSLPMPSHANAWPAAEAALCAGAVGGSFWAMHDRLFADVAEWSEAARPGALFEGYAREAGVPIDAFRRCTVDDIVAPLLMQDVIFGSRVTGTPTFVVNNERTVVGVKSFEEWREILDQALSGR